MSASQLPKNHFAKGEEIKTGTMTSSSFTTKEAAPFLSRVDKIFKRAKCFESSVEETVVLKKYLPQQMNRKVLRATKFFITITKITMVTSKLITVIRKTAKKKSTYWKYQDTKVFLTGVITAMITLHLLSASLPRLK
jgi:hypothetical protein